MLSPNLLKSKKNFTRGLAENFLSFQAKKCLGMLLDFEWLAYTKYTRTTIISSHISKVLKEKETSVPEGSLNILENSLFYQNVTASDHKSQCPVSISSQTT